jgi:hypothetical protein
MIRRSFQRSIFAFFLALGAASSLAWGKEKIFLLTSIVESEQEKIAEAANIFKKHFRHNAYDLMIVHQANKYHLWQAMKDQETRGVFWLSHASVNHDALIDAKGFNIFPMLSKIPSHWQFFALIACNSSKLLTRAQKLYHHNDHPTTFGFDKPIEAISGLQQALEASQKFLPTGEETSILSVKRHFYPNSSSYFYPALSIHIGQLLVDVLPEMNEIQQEQAIYIPIQAGVKPFDMILIDAGDNLSINGHKSHLGIIEVELKQNKTTTKWVPTVNKQGKIMGTTLRIFRKEQHSHVF